MVSHDSIYCQKSELVCQSYAKFILNTADQAISRSGSFFIAFSGGSCLQMFSLGYNKLIQNNEKMNNNFNKWFVFFTDERHVPLNDVYSNYLLLKALFLQKVDIPPQNIFTINPSLTTSEVAKDYESKIYQTINTHLPDSSSSIPVFDVIMLGVGPDGHIASLFPGKRHSFITKDIPTLVIPINDSPKPPKNRISMSIDLINAAREVVIYIGGHEKMSLCTKLFSYNKKSRTITRKISFRDLPINSLKSKNNNWFIDENSIIYDLKLSPPL